MVAVSAVTGVSNIKDDGSKTVDSISNELTSAVNNLSIGDNGKKVLSLQKTLSKYGYYTGKIDGKFGPYTEQAVKNLQADAGIKVDGVVGEVTNSVLRHLNTLLKNDSEGKIGNSESVGSNNDSIRNLKSYSSQNNNSTKKSSSSGNSYSSYRTSGFSIYGGSGKGIGDCWDNSEMLYKKLKAQGKDVRIIQYPTSLSSRHRSVQYYSDGKWVDYDYKGNGYKKVYYATKNKNGAKVIK